MNNTEIIGIIHFQSPIPCRGDALGKSYETNINGVEVIIDFPIIDYKDAPGQSSEFGEKQPVVKRPATLESEREDEWGFVSHYNTRDLNNTSLMGVIVNQVVIRFSTAKDNLDEALNKISEGINKWRVQLYERTIILDKTTIREESSSVFNQTGKGNDIELYYRESYQGVPFEEVLAFQVDITNVNECLLPEEIVSILSGIDVSKNLKLEYQMFINAICEQRAGRTRYAVMEATTAAELCVTQKIYERCNDLGIDGKGLCDIFYRSLGSRFDMLKCLNIQLATNNPGNEIVKPRNDLFHNKKIEPTKEETQKVLNSVFSYLKLYIPEMYE